MKRSPSVRSKTLRKMSKARLLAHVEGCERAATIDPRWLPAARTAAEEWERRKPRKPR